MSEHKSVCFKRTKRHRFYDAIKSYGWDNFTWCVLVTCEESEMDYYETQLISAYNTQGKDGYNDEGGGNKAKNKPGKLFGKDNPMYGRKINDKQKAALLLGRSKESHEKMSKSLKKLWKTEEFNEKMQTRRPKPGSRHTLLINGQVTLITNIAKYCRDNNLCKGNVWGVIRGTIQEYKGITRC